ncbi:MAG: LCP family protein [Eubacteriales bacterium]|nr:LCP family protein [Eubacteriales bacterium]
MVTVTATVMAMEKTERERTRKMPGKRRNKKLIFGCIAAGILMAAVLGNLAYRTHKAQENRHVTAGNSIDMKSGYRNITYNGKEYQYNSLITTILYAGIDSEGKMETNAGYTQAARADSISLAVLDKKHKKMTVIALSRDTMTEVRRYSMSGKDRGMYVTHLGYAYTYGDGGEVSCENLREAVSKLLGGIPINEYAVTNQSSMTYINDLVGGVTVKVPNDDLSDRYPELSAGAMVTLDDTNIRDYLHYRDTAKDLSNEGRIKRHQVYITAYVEQLKQQLQDDMDGTWKKLESMEDYLQTSITKNKYISLAKLLETVEFTADDYCRPEGQNVVGEDHDEEVCSNPLCGSYVSWNGKLCYG